MDLEFDKEIDTLLRKSQGDRGVLIGDKPKAHLDADELSAFAENVLPEKTKQFYMAHIADCNNCRKTLSNLILLNSEAEPAAVSAVAAPIEISVPWYQKLFIFPNIAYVMGSLVLLFSGFFVYSVLQNSTASLSSDVSQIADSETSPGGPNLGYEDPSSATSSNRTVSVANAMSTAANSAMANAANSIANVASLPQNTNVASPTVTGRTSGSGGGGELADQDKNAALGSLDSVAGKPASAPAPAPKVRANEEADDLAFGARNKDQPSEKKESRELAKQKVNVLKEDLPRTDARGPMKSAGPSRNQQNTFPNQIQSEFETATRAVGGKKFQRKDGVWYDTAYRGQGTTNVRRGTDAYRKLDGGLRIIAESMEGVIVTVWKDKAYRIQ